MSNDKEKRIAKQNDQFRKNCGVIKLEDQEIPGMYMMTQGIANLSKTDQFEVIIKIRSYDDFNESNDPYEEHDFGAFELEETKTKILWKINYFDVNYEHGSEDPSNLSKTKRVLTAMLACEY